MNSTLAAVFFALSAVTVADAGQQEYQHLCVEIQQELDVAVEAGMISSMQAADILRRCSQLDSQPQ